MVILEKPSITGVLFALPCSFAVTGHSQLSGGHDVALGFRQCLVRPTVRSLTRRFRAFLAEGLDDGKPSQNLSLNLSEQQSHCSCVGCPVVREFSPVRLCRGALQDSAKPSHRRVPPSPFLI